MDLPISVYFSTLRDISTMRVILLTHKSNHVPSWLKTIHKEQVTKPLLGPPRPYMSYCYNPIHWWMNFEVNLMLLFLWLSVLLPRKTSCMSNTASICLPQGLCIFSSIWPVCFFFFPNYLCVSNHYFFFNSLVKYHFTWDVFPYHPK